MVTEENIRLHNIEDHNIALQHQLRALNVTISSLQSFNFELQSSLRTLKKRKFKDCKHDHECGCDKALCKHCEKICTNKCTTCDINTSRCNTCDNNNDECDNRNCRNYYTKRYENCDCEQEFCIYCEFRLQNAERDSLIWEFQQSDEQEAQHLASAQHNIDSQMQDNTNQDHSTTTHI